MSSKKKIEINGRRFEFELKKRKGTRVVKLSIYQDGYFVVTAPKWYPLYAVNRFIEERSEWVWKIFKGINFIQSKQLGHEHYKKHKEYARVLVKSRLEFYNRFYKFEFKRVAIKNQRSCWGSCSEKGNLNFNYKIFNLDPELQDYVIVHELCHLAELNHGKHFWQLVSQTIPNYKELRKKLKSTSL